MSICNITYNNYNSYFHFTSKFLSPFDFWLFNNIEWESCNNQFYNQMLHAFAFNTTLTIVYTHREKVRGCGSHATLGATLKYGEGDIHISCMGH